MRIYLCSDRKTVAYCDCTPDVAAGLYHATKRSSGWWLPTPLELSDYEHYRPNGWDEMIAYREHLAEYPQSRLQWIIGLAKLGLFGDKRWIMKS